MVALTGYAVVVLLLLTLRSIALRTITPITPLVGIPACPNAGPSKGG